MEKSFISKNKIVYGRVTITIPMPNKTEVMGWINNSGMGRAEFMRVAFLIGANHLAKDINAINKNEIKSSIKG